MSLTALDLCNYITLFLEKYHKSNFQVSWLYTNTCFICRKYVAYISNSFDLKSFLQVESSFRCYNWKGYLKHSSVISWGVIFIDLQSGHLSLALFSQKLTTAIPLEVLFRCVHLHWHLMMSPNMGSCGSTFLTVSLCSSHWAQPLLSDASK